jgi:hypothetical protein
MRVVVLLCCDVKRLQRPSASSSPPQSLSKNSQQSQSLNLFFLSFFLSFFQSVSSLSRLRLFFSNSNDKHTQEQRPTQGGTPPTFVQRARAGWLGRRARVAGHPPNQRPATRAGRLVLKPTTHMRYGPAREREPAGRQKSRFERGRGIGCAFCGFCRVEFGAGLARVGAEGGWACAWCLVWWGFGRALGDACRCCGELGEQMGWLLSLSHLPISRQCGARSAGSRREGKAGVWC